ncbi:MAG: hypothetical protein A2Y40_03635 [Candidatus Margulisbacteria bacterium GWF2_35_9]|nr:MAG: hypothetical protein A2Y40_03635 [Candidatus Margulisbacteria bacterium GWF2_35_9]
MLENKQDLIKLTKHELLRLATDLDVKYRTRMAKPQLITSILEILRIKKKEMDPATERLLSEQTSIYLQDQEEQSTKEEVEASKYKRVQPVLVSVTDEKKLTETNQVEEIHYSPSHAAHVLEDHHQIQDRYGDNSITLMVIDPTHIYGYWDVTHDRRQHVLHQANASGSEYKTMVRLYDVTDITFNGQNAWSTDEYDVNEAPNWYFNVVGNRSYCAEIGLKLWDNRFLVIARSNIITTPRETVSDYYDEEWMMIDFNKNQDLYNEMYRLSGGHYKRNMNSAFITEIIPRDIKITMPTMNLSSEALSSHVLSSQTKKKIEQDFWMWVDTELIVYGQVKPDAKLLMINGEKTKIDKDGRFRIHMALPNGEFPFNVKGVSKDGSMSREITPEVKRTIR